MAFFASLASISGLQAALPSIGRLLTAAPFLEILFQLLAPLLVNAINGLLPVILEFLSMFEGPISGAIVQASLFSKLAVFMIIQTFFVSAISGSVVSELSNIIQNPTTAIIDLLATSLPSQVSQSECVRSSFRFLVQLF